MTRDAQGYCSHTRKARCRAGRAVLLLPRLAGRYTCATLAFFLMACHRTRELRR